MTDEINTPTGEEQEVPAMTPEETPAEEAPAMEGEAAS